MLKTTSQQLIDSFGYEGGRPGQPLKIGAARDQSNISTVATAGDLYNVPAGNVFLITHIVQQIDQSAQLVGTRVTSPTSSESFNGIFLKDAAGTIQHSFSFRGFARYRGIFTDGGGTPDFRAAQPGEVINWQPKYAIPVPSGWLVDMANTDTAWGNSAAIYGVLVSESAARQMGYRVSASTTDADRRYGIASTSGGTDTEVIAARAGKSIRILDVHIRSQPEVAGSNSFRLHQDDDPAVDIFKMVNDNPGELINESFSPDWYLKAGEALQVTSDNEFTCSVNLSYEYVDEDEVPGDLWYASVTPEKATPGTSLVGTFGNITSVSSEMTLYYPRRGTTETGPNKGFQHMAKGYAVFMQKEATTANATDDTEQTRICVSTGASAGNVSLTFGGIASSTNTQLTPVFSASGHDQCTWGIVGGLNLPSKADDGSFWVDVLGYRGAIGAGSTPSEPENDVRDWAVNMWGRTVPSQFSARTNEGT